MRKDWLVLGGVTVVASLIVVAPFLPERAETVAESDRASLTQEDISISVLLVGDIMLDRGVATHAREVGDERLFKGVEKLFAGHDAVIANLEGAITANPSLSELDNTILRFTFDPTYADLLLQSGFTAVSLANNHALDFGEFGYDDTRGFLYTAGVGSFGSPFNDAHIALQLILKNKKLCMVGYHALFNPDTTSVLSKIKTIRPQCDHLILFAHWGEEYQHEPTPKQRESAHAFVDAGVDVVVGAHPHVVEPLEIYNNHAIFYSLGNFLFDQGFSPQVKRGLAVTIKFSASSTSFTLTPVNTYKEVSIAGATTSQAVLADLGVTDPGPFFLNLIY
ncbi:MAG: hypothetical protein G01um101456_403 [Parcubacteria group bacterium Gr01-1014_56]|nr:MAG: hypothetical protein G01um101456_403 [Parcubacteria group bacterium Gr01-1014_56]